MTEHISSFGENFLMLTYLKRYPNSKRTKSWAGRNVYIYTSRGIWRVGGAGYTFITESDAWVLSFEDALKEIAALGVEKAARLVWAKNKPISEFKRQGS